MRGWGEILSANADGIFTWDKDVCNECQDRYRHPFVIFPIENHLRIQYNKDLSGNHRLLFYDSREQEASLMPAWIFTYILNLYRSLFEKTFFPANGDAHLVKAFFKYALRKQG